MKNTSFTIMALVSIAPLVSCSAPVREPVYSRPIYVIAQPQLTTPSWIQAISETRLESKKFSGMHLESDGTLIISVFTSSSERVSFVLDDFRGDPNSVDLLMINLSFHANSRWVINAATPPVDESGRLVCAVIVHTGTAERSLSNELTRMINDGK